jgi:hypothetical protein
MNATGESDLQNYYESIEEKQEAYLRPVIDKILPIMCMSVFGAIPDDLNYKFEPISRPSDEQKVDLGSKHTTAIIEAYNSDLITQKIAMKELRQLEDRTGMFSNITDEIINSADDDIDIGDLPPNNNEFIPYNNDESLFSMDTDPKSLEEEIISEQAAIDQYTADIERSTLQGDWEAATTLQEILNDEKDHLRILKDLKKKRRW